MKHLIVLTFAAAVGFTGLAHAGNAGSSLGACYDHVVVACNQTAHPVTCANSGFDDCDEEHSASASPLKLTKAKLARTKAKRSLKRRN